MTLNFPPNPTKDYLVATDVRSSAFSPMIVRATSKKKAAKKAAAVWTDATKLYVVRLRDFEEFEIERAPKSTLTYFQPWGEAIKCE